MASSNDDVTQILLDWAKGDQTALDKLIPIIYGELRRIARRQLNRERPGHTLQSAALVNEAYLRLIDQNRTSWKNRAQFFAVSAHLMRRILVDYARSRLSTKRGGGNLPDPQSPTSDIPWQPAKEIVAIDDALADLANVDGRKARIVELRYFAGLSVEETAETLELSPRTIMREWSVARAWLYKTISGG
jgi:RNA polymerase sigma factor (TIGR02999 family)